MTLEAQLLKIIEDQQLQLKQQQQVQEEALQLIQAQSATINELKQYTQTLNDKHSEAVKIVQKYQQIVQNLSEQTISDRAESIRTDYFSKFFSETTRKFGISASRTFERVSDEFEYRFRGEANNSQRATEVSASRDRATIEADGRSNHQENDFSRAISTKISGINPTAIFSALDMLDQRRELQRAQERKNDRGYDSPSPF